jgi:DNA mismatch endonuclease (patch repair protein)
MEDDFKKSHNRKFWIKKIKRNMERDARVNKTLKNAGWTILRFWESDIKKDPMTCAKKVLKVKRSRETAGIENISK